jgi:hypothetical protein
VFAKLDEQRQRCNVQGVYSKSNKDKYKKIPCSPMMKNSADCVVTAKGAPMHILTVRSAGRSFPVPLLHYDPLSSIIGIIGKYGEIDRIPPLYDHLHFSHGVDGQRIVQMSQICSWVLAFRSPSRVRVGAINFPPNRTSSKISVVQTQLMARLQLDAAKDLPQCRVIP